jgi:hypothetical protein
MDTGTGAGRIISARILAVSQPVQLVRVLQGENAHEYSNCFSSSHEAWCWAQQHSQTRESAAQPVVLRLDSVPATAENRYRISERVRRLNRALEESGTPFRLRVL